MNNLSAKQRLFDTTLKNAVCGDYAVMPSVRLVDVLRKKTKTHWWIRFFAPSGYNIDYVLLAPESGEVLCCIGLCVDPHQTNNFAELAKKSLKNANIPMISISPRRQHDPVGIREQIDHAIG